MNHFKKDSNKKSVMEVFYQPSMFINIKALLQHFTIGGRN
jgi:hypothetical protein